MFNNGTRLVLSIIFGGLERFVLFCFRTKCLGFFMLRVAAKFGFFPGFAAIWHFRFRLFNFGVVVCNFLFLNLLVFFHFLVGFGGILRFFPGVFFLFFEFRVFDNGCGLGGFGGRNAGLSLFMLGFHQLSGKSAKLFVAKCSGSVLRGLRRGFFRRVNFRGAGGISHGFGDGLLVAGIRGECFAFGFVVG